MTKNEEDVRTRLQRAALALFQERGYEQTTAAEIAARVGVTERTFFRHFPDKREVLFQGEAILRAALTASIASAPAEIGPLDTLFRAFHAIQQVIEANRPFAKPRHDVISNTPALQERELAKTEALARSLADALQARGVSELHAALAARAGMAAFAYATISWLEDPEIGLAERLDRAYDGLKSLF
ncbi:helix-turn-helix domain-containing protein [Robbsia sp. KACC 23696]|uniref:TetR/AcrR family transcriptional regulator n=1 Tax=Robbsia sp. KACC 23696 TaxID=3149231 RepID=UPI00325BEFB8